MHPWTTNNSVIEPLQNRRPGVRCTSVIHWLRFVAALERLLLVDVHPDVNQHREIELIFFSPRRTARSGRPFQGNQSAPTAAAWQLFSAAMRVRPDGAAIALGA